MALGGADLLVYPTAIGWDTVDGDDERRRQLESWMLIQRSHAVANGCYVCAPNRVGHEIILGADGNPVNAEGIEFWGQSFVAGPDGGRQSWRKS